jgi:Peroxisomal membrane protein (Pex16)
MQVVAEKAASAVGGPAGHRNVITTIEAVKAVCRLAVLAINREMLLDGGSDVSTVIRLLH